LARLVEVSTYTLGPPTKKVTYIILTGMIRIYYGKSKDWMPSSFVGSIKGIALMDGRYCEENSRNCIGDEWLFAS
jgi:hypothetical protein